MPNNEEALIAEQRAWLHAAIIERGVLAINSQGIASNADKGNQASRSISAGLARQIMRETEIELTTAKQGRRLDRPSNFWSPNSCSGRFRSFST